MNHRPTPKFPEWIAAVALLIALLLGALPAVTAAAQTADNPTPHATTVIAWARVTGFSASDVNIKRGETVTWRNASDTPLTLRSGPPARLFLPLAAGSGDIAGAGADAPAPVATQPAAAAPGFETVIKPGEAFSFQFTSAGSYSFFDAGQPDFAGVVHVDENLAASSIDCGAGTAGGSGGVEADLPKVMYDPQAARMLSISAASSRYASCCRASFWASSRAARNWT